MFGPRPFDAPVSSDHRTQLREAAASYKERRMLWSWWLPSHWRWNWQNQGDRAPRLLLIRVTTQKAGSAST